MPHGRVTHDEATDWAHAKGDFQGDSVMPSRSLEAGGSIRKRTAEVKFGLSTGQEWPTPRMPGLGVPRLFRWQPFSDRAGGGLHLAVANTLTPYFPTPFAANRSSAQEEWA
ncbi:MAG: DNA-binding proteins Bright/BRCAA1/RBP1 and proteins containing BRIGHT domain [Chaenotheca gracillima]|nr:MAG: DNA-binding proteins Bright/BRCAA1/RBP1 and proteins containing BRIGHT domain [Chaenotheca gracillima]